MADHLRILCKSGRPVMFSEVADFLREGHYFDNPPAFALESYIPETNRGVEWRADIRYQSNVRPIVVVNTGPGDLMTQELDEICSGLAVLTVGSATDVANHAAATRRIIDIEINGDDMDDDAWAMIDCLESFLARQFDGIIYAPGDGYYNSSLSLLLKLA